MANLPNEEGFEQENDLTLPLIEDLPFDSDIDFAEADLNFLQHYRDLLETVEVEDIGLDTSIQGVKESYPAQLEEQDSLVESSSNVEVTPEEDSISEIEWDFPQQTENTDDVSVGWNLEEDAPIEKLDLSWEE
ncbi:MAG: hypothetical protein CV045_10515, partial [Cyanobacteria bacterium M5B4]